MGHIGCIWTVTYVYIGFHWLYIRTCLDERLKGTQRVEFTAKVSREEFVKVYRGAIQQWSNGIS